MICVVDENNIIVNIVNGDIPVEENDRIGYPWNYPLEVYTDVPPLEYLCQQEANSIKERLREISIQAGMMSLAGNDIGEYKKQYTEMINAFSDNVALYIPEVFPMWSADAVQYEVGQRVQYNGVLYKVLTGHTSQKSWKPDVSPSLFVKVISSISGEIPEWEQPLPTNAYKLGDRVKHNGRYYESTYDGANVWEPGVVGEEYWKDITDEIGEAS